VKVARVEPFHVDWGEARSRSTWVRIWTDEGVYGLGEASPMVSVGHTANLHFVASLTHSHHPAEDNGPREIQDAVFRTPVRPARGVFKLSEAPGLGLELDEGALRARAIPWRSSAAAA
jgi:L-alanine-DL-glutamate epimerase-like enolase superfamily enzyme